jgi:hypothetical protein
MEMCETDSDQSESFGKRKVQIRTRQVSTLAVSKEKEDW